MLSGAVRAVQPHSVSSYLSPIEGCSGLLREPPARPRGNDGLARLIIKDGTLFSANPFHAILILPLTSHRLPLTAFHPTFSTLWMSKPVTLASGVPADGRSRRSVAPASSDNCGETSA